MPGFLWLVALVMAFAGSWNGEQKTSAKDREKAVATAEPMSASSSAVPPTSASASGSPTLPETTEWLANHLSGVIHTSRKTVITYKAKKGKDPKEVSRLATNTHESVSVASFEGCSLTLGQLTKGDDYTVVIISTIPLDHVTGASWKIVKEDSVKSADGLDFTETNIAPDSVVVITLEAATNSITWRRKSSGSVPLEVDALPYEGQSSSIQIHSDDLAMPPRLVKAFNHAIDLCRVSVKPEPF